MQRANALRTRLAPLQHQHSLPAQPLRWALPPRTLQTLSLLLHCMRKAEAPHASMLLLLSYLRLSHELCTSRSRRGAVRTFAAKELHFNRSGETLKRMQAGVDKLASVVGVTLGPKVSNE